MIVQNLVDIEKTLPVITLDPTLEQMLHNILQQSNSSQGLVIEPGLAEQLFQSWLNTQRQLKSRKPGRAGCFSFN